MVKTEKRKTGKTKNGKTEIVELFIEEKTLQNSNIRHRGAAGEKRRAWRQRLNREALSGASFFLSSMAHIFKSQIYTCNGHGLRFQSKGAEHGAAALDVLGAWRGARSSGRLALSSLFFIAGLLTLGRWK